MFTFISKKGEKVCVEKYILKDCKIIMDLFELDDNESF